MGNIDKSIFVYSLLTTFNNVLKLKLCNNSKLFIDETSNKFDNLEVDQKMYYTKYAMDVATSLVSVVNFSNIELNYTMSEDIYKKKDFDISLFYDNNDKVNVLFSTTSIKVNNIIPNKLMKKCKYIKSTKVYKEYTEMYNTINNSAYCAFKNKNKFSDLSKEDIDKYLLVPVSKLIVDTLSHKKKHAQNFYNAIFNETNKMTVRLYKNRFTIYDFYKTMSIKSLSISRNKNNILKIRFNNNASFTCYLASNSVEIKENLSLKLHIKFENIDEIYKI